MDEPSLDLDVYLKREPGGRVVTSWELDPQQQIVVSQAYVQPDGTLVYERTLKVVK